MSSNADWSMDFCLYCDKHTCEGAYCSQACRSADLEKAEPSYAMTPSPSSSVTSSCSSDRRGFAFYLPPAIDFAAYRTSSSSPSRNMDSTYTQQMQSRRVSEDKTAAADINSMEGIHVRGRSAHSSIDSTNMFWNQQTTLSDKAKRELQQYDDCFEDSRYRRRRSWALF